MRPLYYIDIASQIEALTVIKAIQRKYPESLILSNDLADFIDSPNVFPLSHTKNLLGTTSQSIIFDARFGFALDCFLAIANTVEKGNALYLLYNPDKSKDEDSKRFHDQMIFTPHFNHYLNKGLRKYGVQLNSELSVISERGLLNATFQIGGNNKSIDPIDFDAQKNIHRDELKPTMGAIDRAISSQKSLEQKAIIDNFLRQEEGVFTLFSPRGTGKSWLGNELIKKLEAPIITAPNQNALFVYQSANTFLNFYAPDFLIATYSKDAPSNKVLIIEEAARIPLAHISALATRFKKVLIISSIDNYEGTGQGLRSKLADLIPLTKHYQLTQSYRFQSDDDLSQFCGYISMRSSLIDQTQNVISKGTILCADESLNTFRAHSQNIVEFYQLMNRTHYQTNAQDIRRLMDAEKQVLIAHYKNDVLIAGIWAMIEGGLSKALSLDVFNGLRRPKGNLVAQTLSAHSYYPECMEMRSVRISRISVDHSFRRQNRARAMIHELAKHYADSHDFISTSFGLTKGLKNFWDECGFTWIHIGSHRDKTTGLHAAIMICPLSQRGKAWLKAAKEKWQADAFYLKDAPFLSEEARALLPESQNGGAFDALDKQMIASHKDKKKPKEAVFCALKRMTVFWK